LQYPMKKLIKISKYKRYINYQNQYKSNKTFLNIIKN
jgi:hypothetical protein